MLRNGGEHEGLSRGHGLDLDGQTQEFNLGTPRLRTDLEEPSTPEMPDLSSITQDICKVCEIIFNPVIPVLWSVIYSSFVLQLLSQAQLKKTAMMAAQPNVRTDEM